MEEDEEISKLLDLDPEEEEDMNERAAASNDIAKRRRESGGFLKVAKQGRDDWLNLMETGKIEKQKFSRKDYEDDVAEKVVEFILCEENVQLLSWGNRRIKCNGKWEIIPSILKKCSTESLWRLYNEHLDKESIQQRIGGKGTFGQLEASKKLNFN